jgi:hypothetical protein
MFKTRSSTDDAQVQNPDQMNTIHQSYEFNAPSLSSFFCNLDGSATCFEAWDAPSMAAVVLFGSSELLASAGIARLVFTLPRQITDN